MKTNISKRYGNKYFKKVWKQILKKNENKDLKKRKQFFLKKVWKQMFKKNENKYIKKVWNQI